jgi:hypothetical protein
MKCYLIAFAMAFLLFGCLDQGCSNDPIKQAVSPSGTWKAVAFSRNCGATTGVNIQVSVIAANQDLRGDASGNALIVDHTELVSLQWKSDSELQITTATAARVFKQEAVINGVAIKVSPVSQGAT